KDVLRADNAGEFALLVHQRNGKAAFGKRIKIVQHALWGRGGKLFVKCVFQLNSVAVGGVRRLIADDAREFSVIDDVDGVDVHFLHPGHGTGDIVGSEVEGVRRAGDGGGGKDL